MFGERYGLAELGLEGFGKALALAVVEGRGGGHFRRRFPASVLAVVMSVTVAYILRGYPFGPVFASPVVAAVGVVSAGRRRVSWAIVGGGAAVLCGLGALTPFGPFLLPYWNLGHALGILTWLVILLTGAEIIRIRRERAAEIRRTRAEEQRRQASEERLRIARELHDVLAHNISMINVQAGVALHLMDEQPEQARTALSAIKEASKEALTEMRSVIGALRAQGETAPRSPTAGLGRLDDLLDRARSAGLAVDAEITGERRPLPAGADLAAFRIVQESLTNVTRHAGPGPVTVRVRIAYREREIEVRVEDDGRGASLLDDHPGGSGIRGMRERAAALGGTFDAGPRAGGGFAVRAALPLNGEPEDDADGDGATGTTGAGEGTPAERGGR